MVRRVPEGKTAPRPAVLLVPLLAVPLLAALLLAPWPLVSPASPRYAAGQAVSAPPFDTLSLGRGPYARMGMLWEKTIFQVDVLTLEVWVDEGTARRLEELARGRRYSSELADSIAEVATHARDVFARTEFKRDVSLDQFVDGVRKNLRRARDAGILSPQDYEKISQALPRWFGFLAERRIRDGDRILYRIRGDSLRTQFRSVGGEILLDQTDVGPERRLAVLGSYFVRKSEFRKGLIKSLFETGLPR